MIGRWMTFGVASWCFLIGVWRHDWVLIGASLGLLVVFASIAAEVHRDV